jgi:hypothetical protein
MNSGPGCVPQIHSGRGKCSNEHPHAAPPPVPCHRSTLDVGTVAAKPPTPPQPAPAPQLRATDPHWTWEPWQQTLPCRRQPLGPEGPDRLGQRQRRHLRCRERPQELDGCTRRLRREPEPITRTPFMTQYYTAGGRRMERRHHLVLRREEPAATDHRNVLGVPLSAFSVSRGAAS